MSVEPKFYTESHKTTEKHIYKIFNGPMEMGKRVSRFPVTVIPSLRVLIFALVKM